MLATPPKVRGYWSEVDSTILHVLIIIIIVFLGHSPTPAVVPSAICPRVGLALFLLALLLLILLVLLFIFFFLLLLTTLLLIAALLGFVLFHIIVLAALWLLVSGSNVVSLIRVIEQSLQNFRALLSSQVVPDPNRAWRNRSHLG